MLKPGKLYRLKEQYKNKARFQIVIEDPKKGYYTPSNKNFVSIDNETLMFIDIRKVYYNCEYTPLRSIFLLRNDFFSTDNMGHSCFELVTQC